MARKESSEFELAAVVARRQAKRDADHEGEERGEGGDLDHDLAALDHAGEDIAAEVIAAEEIPRGSIRQRRARGLVLELADLRQRICGHDEIGEDRGEDPEHHDAEPDHADHGIEELAVKPEFAFEADRDEVEHDEGDPDRQEPFGDGADDASLAVGQGETAKKVEQAERNESQEEPLRGPRRRTIKAPAGRGRPIGQCGHARIGRDERQHYLRDHRDDEEQGHPPEDGVEQ